MSLPAEIAYLFRHAVVRDAAYDLQPPSSRASLHAMALQILEALAATMPAGTLDAWSEELADHARRAIESEGADREAILRQELEYLLRGAKHEAGLWHNERSVALRARIADHELADDAQRIRALLDNVETLMRSGSIHKTPALLDAVWELAQASGKPALVVMALAARAQGAAMQSRHEEVARLVEQGIAAALEIDDSETHGRLLVTLASDAQATGDWVKGEAAARRALELLAGTHHAASEARAHLYIGDACWEQGKLEEGVSEYREALKIYQAAGNLGGEASARDHLGSLLTELQRKDEAGQQHERAKEIYSDIGDTVGYGAAVSNIASLMEVDGQHAAARVHRLQALKNFRSAGATYMEGIALGNLGHLARLLGRLEEASRCFQKARDLLKRQGRVVEHAVFESGLGQLLLLTGFTDAAEANGRAASDELTRINVFHWREKYATMLLIRVAAERAVGGSSKALRDGEDLLRRMGDARKEIDGGLKSTYESAAKLMEEAGKPQPFIYCGHLPDELPAPLRVALLDRLEKADPAGWADLQQRPALLAALREGTEELAVPDWRNVGEA
ncbi:MAG: tetratricopeptide repeat protein [Planctomycetes bacterium]|nr:tetratricopeptide repeat protein [Planctomycetota bacterium]